MFNLGTLIPDQVLKVHAPYILTWSYPLNYCVQSQIQILTSDLSYPRIPSFKP